jgi:hypothetical protein
VGRYTVEIRETIPMGQQLEQLEHLAELKQGGPLAEERTPETHRVNHEAAPRGHPGGHQGWRSSAMSASEEVSGESGALDASVLLLRASPIECRPDLLTMAARGMPWDPIITAGNRSMSERNAGSTRSLPSSYSCDRIGRPWLRRSSPWQARHTLRACSAADHRPSATHHRPSAEIQISDRRAW